MRTWSHGRRMGWWACQCAMLMAVLLHAAGPARGQCPDWRPHSGLYDIPGVTASTVWDPDGAGPQPPLLVVGGVFDHVDSGLGLPVTNLAAWDGSAWHPLGDGVGPNFTGFVQALAVYNGELIAAGLFASASGTSASNIARWNGSAWQPLGAGTNGTVNALAVRAGTLVAAGSFTQAGGVAASNIASWNGSTWSALGAGTNGTVLSLAVLQNGDLIAGGGFTQAGGLARARIARYSGTTWLDMNGGTSASWVYALLVRANGDLIAAGDFSSAGGVANTGLVARWTVGAGWTSMGATITGTSPLGMSLGEYAGQVILGGRFQAVNSIAVANVARWTGSTWQAMQFGVGTQTYDDVQTIAVYNNEAIVAGTFAATGTAGVNYARSVARWDGAAWQSIPGFVCARNEFLYSMAAWNNSLVIGGDYSTQNTNLPHSTRYLSAWDGLNQRELGSPAGVPNDAVYGLGTAPAILGTTDLIIGGRFTSVAGTSASHIAKLGSASGAAWTPMGPGFNDDVYAIVYNPNDATVYAAGNFTAAGPTACNRIARWNGSTWQALGSGLNGLPQTLRVYNGSVYVGGFFTTAGGINTGGFARWDGAWHNNGGTFAGTVRALEVYQSLLIIGGTFPGISSSPSIAAYDGTSYSTLGLGGARLADTTTANVNALTVSNGTLIAGGNFATMSGVPAAYIARWDGSVWTPVGNGVQANVRCLTSFQSEVDLGGDFAFVNNNTVMSPSWARYSETGAPWCINQPSFQFPSCGLPASFTAMPASGYDIVSYQWRHGGVPISDGPTGSGSLISGAHTAALSITNVGTADNGSYDCVLSTACASGAGGGGTIVVPGGVSGPSIMSQPASAAACSSGTTVLSVTAFGDAPLSYQWRRAGVPLADIPGHVSGATSANLSITHALPADAGSYDCRVSNACGIVTSDPAILSVCYANCDCSAAAPTLNVLDFACFLNKYAAGDLYANCDGSTTPPVLNVLDFACFLNKYAAGCP